ncbi:phosphoribosyl-AMP cyclohydrolase [Tychonema sp. BBK16]|nr:phosphoribosyl-AMP cyclohydrolase [Tychonema sp. BBK16]MCF6374866.1 hypothetical protein [Tychonema sp. BBK16]
MNQESLHLQVRECQDCDADTILLKIEQIGEIACHTGARSCFFNKVCTLV